MPDIKIRMDACLWAIKNMISFLHNICKQQHKLQQNMQTHTSPRHNKALKHQFTQYNYFLMTHFFVKIFFTKC